MLLWPHPPPNNSMVFKWINVNHTVNRKVEIVYGMKNYVLNQMCDLKELINLLWFNLFRFKQYLNIIYIYIYIYMIGNAFLWQDYITRTLALLKQNKLLFSWHYWHYIALWKSTHQFRLQDFLIKHHRIQKTYISGVVKIYFRNKKYISMW